MSYESYVIVVGVRVSCGLIGAISVVHVVVFLLLLKCMIKGSLGTSRAFVECSKFKKNDPMSPCSAVMTKRKEVVTETKRNQLKDGLFLSGVSGWEKRDETAKRQRNCITLSQLKMPKR